MRYLIVCLILAVVLAAPAAAGLRQCNSVMVNQTLCADLTQDLLYVRLAGDARADVAAALAESIGWTAQVTCTPVMVAAAKCLEAQLGQQIANPETRPQAASRALRLFVQGTVRSYFAEGHRTTKRRELQQLLDAIGTPAVTE